jgi:hypothetical protein
MGKRCVLAYSGGLDTSVILGWLIEQGYEVVAVYVDLGQPCEDREAILAKARDCGAVRALIVDVREELCRDLAFPTMPWQARYEGTYLLGTSIATGITGCSRRTTSSGGPSRHWRSGTSASNVRSRPGDMETTVTPREAALTRIKNPARTTPLGLPGRNSWPGWGRSFRSSARTAAATSG